ncbi:hypothetical protein FGRMN_6204 [Fusarium graminum]|nr:hypothetical protein FGRMN_6204 [Fusarium graminum]
MDHQGPVKTPQEWYLERCPLTVDVVGDFAGEEVFAIHGESLMRHCLVEAKADFDGGCRLLHAVQAIQTFLREFKRRDYVSDLVFFRDLRDTCVAKEVIGSAKAAKYYLTRRILIQHLSRSKLDFDILEIGSFESQE